MPEPENSLLYNDELARLKSVYGENARGNVSFQQIQRDLAADGEAASTFSFKGNSISQLENAVREGLKNNPPKIIQAKEKKAEISDNVRTEKMKRLEKRLREGTLKNNDELNMRV